MFYQASACARRRISVLRPSFKASIGRPGRESSSVYSQTIASSSLNPESLSTTRVPFKDSKTRFPFKKSAGTLRTLVSGSRKAIKDPSERRLCMRVIFRSRISAISGIVTLAYKGKGLSNIFVSHPLRVPESLINYHLFRTASWCVASSVLI